MSRDDALRRFSDRTVGPLASRFPLVDLFWEDTARLSYARGHGAGEPLSFARITGASFRALSETARAGGSTTDVGGAGLTGLLAAAGGRPRHAPALPEEARLGVGPGRGELTPWVDALEALAGDVRRLLPPSTRAVCALEWDRGVRGIVAGGRAAKRWTSSYALLSARVSRSDGTHFTRERAYDAAGPPPPPDDTEALARSLADAVRTFARARRVPHGTFPVVLAPGAGAVLFHEIVGHPLEADFILKDLSPFASLSLGEEVSSRALTIVDRPETTFGAWGFALDDDGVRARPAPLITRGHVVGMLHDRVSAYRLGKRPTGNARRARFDLDAEPRMRTLVVEAGTDDPEALVASVRDGVYVLRFGAGSSDLTRGTFSLEVEEGRQIRGGKLADPVRGFQIRGDALAALRAVDGVGWDVETLADPVPCLKGGLVATGVAGPTVRVRGLEVA